MGKLDRGTLNVIVGYVVQMEGRPTVNEVYETITEKIQAKATKREVRDAIEAIKKRGLVSVNFDHDENDKMIERYSMATVKWAHPPEIAHIKTLLPALLETPEAKEFQKMLEGIHEEGEKKGRLPDIRDYVKYQVKMEVVTPMLGGWPSPDKTLVFRRIGKDIWFPLNLWMKPALELELRTRNVSVSKTKYLKFSNVFVPEKDVGELGEVTCPINLDNGQGGGISKHEAIMPGFQFEFTVSFPTTGFMKEKDFLECFEEINLGSKHKDYGLLRLVNTAKVK